MITYLSCDHCGDEAVQSDADGTFHEDMADKCMSCGFPGHVYIDEDLDDANWYENFYDENARCTRPDCRDGCLENA